MLNIQSILHQLGRKIAIFIIAGLVVLISLPTNSVLADGYYSSKSRSVERMPPYYTTKDLRIARNESNKPYYATKERQHSKAARKDEDYIKTGKRENEVRIRDLETRNR
ncbi:hypothetical protein IQ259_09730 [Fortiea sp. LEGE XX443]|uniref:hypothetical protein n=1 Tax=Fortiea sp. LEGE XX443 TaxID=1828611 RepID=UPI0018809D79|nr:hypothetical protein [Fortiea sp. LEGE XX443]MBE9005314.1 hypothetical protein [Fortiea sp. LEGE XX443]